MNRDQLRARVHTIISEHLGATVDDPPTFTEASAFVADLDFDSLDIVEVAMHLEDAFDIEIPDDHIERFKVVADVDAYLAERLGLVEVAA